MSQFNVGDLIILAPGSERYIITNDCTICRVVEAYDKERHCNTIKLDSDKRRYAGVGNLIVEIVEPITEDEMEERNTYSRSFDKSKIGNQYAVESEWFELYQPTVTSVVEVTPMDEISFEEVFADE